VIYTVAISDEDLRVIGAALGELPYRLAQGVVERLKGQTDAIDAERARPPEPPDALCAK